jgi:hypothetical protein
VTPPAVVPEGIERGLAKARELEQAGKVQEAIVAYEVVVAAAPEHGEARERIAALRALLPAGPGPGADTMPTAFVVPTTEPTPTDSGKPAADTTATAEPVADSAATADTATVDTGKPASDTGDTKVDPTAGDVKPVDVTPVAFLVEATPRAEVIVDGESRGKTPLTIPLTPGPHKFELKATNYTPHTETIEVAGDGQKSLKAKLVRKTGGGGSGGINRAEEDAASAQLDPDSDAPTTKIEIKR